MAAKFDGQRASNNMWVAQQNLAKAKGGRPLYQPKARSPRVAPPVAKSTHTEGVVTAEATASPAFAPPSEK